MSSLLFIYPEIFLLTSFFFFFSYSLYSKIEIKTFDNSVATRLYMYLSQLKNFVRKDDVEFKKSLNSFLVKNARILSNSEKKALLYISFVCFLSVFLYLYQLSWFLNELVYFDERALLFSSTYTVDSFTIFMKIFVLILCTFYFLISYFVSSVWKFFGFEFGILIFIVMFSILVMISANDFFLLFLSLELQTLSIVVLSSYQITQKRSVEAGLKYFIFSSFFSGILLFSISLMYILLGTISFEPIYQLTIGGTLGSKLKDDLFIFSLILFFSTIFFKLGVVPYHFWTPDLYQGSGLLVTTFLAVISKIGLVSILIRLCYTVLLNYFFILGDMLYFIGIFSMIIGALIALFQTDLRRFLAYTSVSNLGYVVLGLSFGSLEGVTYSLFYFILYTFSTFSFFILLLGLINKDMFSVNKSNDLESNQYDFKFLVSINDLQGLSKSNKVLVFFSLMALFNLIGVPPFNFFFAKYLLFDTSLRYNYGLAVFFVIIASFLSAFYYLRIIRTMFLDRTFTNRNYSFSSKYLSYFFFVINFFVLILFVHPSFFENILFYLENIVITFF